MKILNKPNKNKEKLLGKNRESRKKTLEKNMSFFTYTDIRNEFKKVNDQRDKLALLYFELFQALEFDDSIVFNLTKEIVDIEKIENAESIVVKFNASTKFKTLIKNHEEAFKDIFGEELYNNKINSIKKHKWGKPNKWGKPSKLN